MPSEFGTSLCTDRNVCHAWVVYGVGISRMRETVPLESLARTLSRIPRRFHTLFDGIPRFICIQAGASAQHVLTCNASQEDWLANENLKQAHIDDMTVSKDWSHDMRRMLVSLGATSINDI